MSNKPQRLGKYRIVRELSRNSSAAVFLGHDPYVDRPVALKVPAASIARDISLSQRFHELRRLASFPELSDEELWTIIRGSIRQEFSDDDPILSGGDHSESPLFGAQDQ